MKIQATSIDLFLGTQLYPSFGWVTAVMIPLAQSYFKVASVEVLGLTIMWESLYCTTFDVGSSPMLSAGSWTTGQALSSWMVVLICICNIFSVQACCFWNKGCLIYVVCESRLPGEVRSDKSGSIERLYSFIVGWAPCTVG